MDPISVSHIQQGVKIPWASQLWVDSIIILGIVAMVGGGLKDGVKVDRIDTQIQQVIEMIDDAPQISTLEIPVGRRRTPGVHIGRIIRRIAVCETIWEDLVEDSVVDPGGNRHGIRVWV
jgi:hypothetical protein